MASIGSLYGTLRLNTAEYERGVKRASLATKQFKRQVDVIGTAIAARFAPVAAFAALTRAIPTLVQFGSALTDQSEQMRINIEALQSLQSAARQAGVAQEVMLRGIRNVTLRTEEAIAGNESYARAFRVLNIDLKNFQTLATEDKIDAIGRAYVRSGKSAEAYNAVSRILGEKAGPALTEVLARLGTEGFDEVRRAAEESGEILDAFSAQTLDSLADSFEKATTQAKVFGATMLANTVNVLSGKGPLMQGAATTAGILGSMVDELTGGTGTDSVEAIPDKLTQMLERIKSPIQKAVDLNYEISQYLEKYGDQLTVEERARLTNYSLDEYKKALDLEEGTNSLADAAEDLGLTFSSAFEDAIVGGEDLRDVLKGLADDILRIAVRKSITEPLGGALSSLFGGIFGGFKASGGSVFSDRAYIVGEKGPEMFVPGRPGVILPNGYGAGSSGEGSVAVTINQNFAVGVTDTVRAEMVAMMPTFKAVAVGAVREAKMQRKLK